MTEVPGNQQNKETTVSRDKAKTKDERRFDLMKGILLYMHKEGYPGREKLAEILGVSAKTIDRYLDELEGRGAIVRTGRTTSLYQNSLQEQ